MSTRTKAPTLPLPHLVRESDLVAFGLARADAQRVMRLARPVIRIPGGRAVYVKRDAVVKVLAAAESWTA